RYDLKFVTYDLESLSWDPSKEQSIKDSCISKNAMSKIRNGHHHAIGFHPSSIAKVNRAIDKGASSYCGGSIST
ncbi:hypothetical protein CR513_13008, partial [Mucuna pruriens]